MQPGPMIASAGATIAAGFAVKRLLTMAWKLVTGHKPPDETDNSDGNLTEVLVFAALSGALIAIARLLAARGAAKLYGDPIPKTP